MLSDIEVRDLARRMSIPLVFCSFKDNLARETLQYNKSYVVNMESTTDPETGKENEGSHYVFPVQQISLWREAVHILRFVRPTSSWRNKGLLCTYKGSFQHQRYSISNGRLLRVLLFGLLAFHQFLSSKNRSSLRRQRIVYWPFSRLEQIQWP